MPQKKTNKWGCQLNRLKEETGEKLRTYQQVLCLHKNVVRCSDVWLRCEQSDRPQATLVVLVGSCNENSQRCSAFIHRQVDSAAQLASVSQIFAILGATQGCRAYHKVR